MYHQLYVESERRLEELVRPLDAAALDALTPACPEWSVRDILAHLAGAAASFGTPSFSGVGTDDWTEEQVRSRQGRPVAELLAERWLHTPRLAGVPADNNRAWLPIVHDALTHEADIRGALGAPRLPADALAAAYPLIEAALPRQLGRLGTVELELDGRRSVLGDGGTPDLVVRAPLFEFWRGWFGRRSRGQLRSWVRAGDAEAFAEALPVFAARDTDLLEST